LLRKSQLSVRVTGELSEHFWYGAQDPRAAMVLVSKAISAVAAIAATISKTPGIKKLLSKGAKAEKSPLNWSARVGDGLFPTNLVRKQWDQSRKPS